MINFYPVHNKMDQRFMRWVLVGLLALILFGCASSSFIPSPSADVRPVFDGEVKVLRSYPAEGTYEHVGVVLVTGRDLSDEKDLIALMVKIAAERGANALIVQSKPIKVRTTSGSQLKMAGTAIWQAP